MNQTAAVRLSLRTASWRKVRAPQGMMPGNSRAEDREVFRQTAQQKVYRPVTGKGEMAG